MSDVNENRSHVIVSERKGVPLCYVSRIGRDGSICCTWDASKARRFIEVTAALKADDLNGRFRAVRFESRPA